MSKSEKLREALYEAVAIPQKGVRYVDSNVRIVRAICTELGITREMVALLGMSLDSSAHKAADALATLLDVAEGKSPSVSQEEATET
jgi:hypothetical protein